MGILSTDEVDKQGADDSDLNPLQEAESRWHHWRAKIAAKPSLELTYRIVVGVIGGVVLVVGIIAIPYPGPGWLIVFAGLGILASEFDWAHRLLHLVKERYDLFMVWFSNQSILVRGLGVLFTAAVVMVTLWILGTFGLVGSWVGLDYTWLKSPL